MSKEQTEKVEEVKRVRVPMGGRRTKLQLSDEDAQALKDAGWTPRWVSDKDGRIQQALSGGYVFVEPSEAPSIGQFSLTKGSNSLDKKVSLTVSRSGDPITGVLMKLQTKYYNEDQVSKEQANIDFDNALNAGQPGGNVVDNQYVPEGHVNRV